MPNPTTPARPEQVKVGWKVYRVIWENALWALDSGYNGRIDYRECTITVCEDRPDNDVACTFWHEVEHAILNYFDRLNAANEKPLDREQAVEWTAEGTMMVWRDNPEAFDWWVAMVKSEAS